MKAVIKSCQVCQLTKGGGKLRSADIELHSIPVTGFMHRIALDTAGPLPCTQRGNKYILMAIDHFSKWVEVKEVKGHDANTTTEFLEREVLGRGFVPKIVLTDNGTEWQGEFKLLCEQNGIKHDHSSVYWPQGNGLAERLIQTLKRGLATMIAQHGGEWDEHLQQVLRGYRCSKQASTQMSPFFVMTGRHPCMVIENVLDPEWQSQDHLESVESDTGGVMEKAITIFQVDQQVLVNIEQAQARQQI